jgi:hypothetical protein
MKSLTLIAAVLALMAAANAPPTMAQDSKPPGSGARPGLPHQSDPGSTNAAMSSMHYDYRYGYDRHSAWRGHWVLVR